MRATGSLLRVKLTLQRIFLYHLTNTYLPSTCLVSFTNISSLVIFLQIESFTESFKACVGFKAFSEGLYLFLFKKITSLENFVNMT
jgi:hypothetical protein